MIITKQNGVQIDVVELNMKLLKYRIPSPSLSHLTETIEGRDGDIFLGSSYQNRFITAEMLYKSEDVEDYLRLKSEFHRLFATKEAFYITFKREPLKRWKVRLNSPFEVEKFNSFTGTFTLEFVTDTPFSESVDSTLDMVIPQFSGSKPQQYTHSTSSFEILNDGDVSIDPRILPLVIQYRGASTNLNIENLTTGDVWTYTGSTLVTGSLKLNGVQSFRGSTESIFKNTNRKLITLAPGWNEFQLTGASGAYEISFDFRFYTL
jgi:predicted phage tail component-like protein